MAHGVQLEAQAVESHGLEPAVKYCGLAGLYTPLQSAPGPSTRSEGHLGQ